MSNKRTIRQVLDENPEVFGELSNADAAAEMNKLQFPGKRRMAVLEIAAELGTGVSGRLVASMEAASATDFTVKHVLRLLENGGTVDINHTTTRVMLDSFAANADLPLTTDDAAAIKTLADNRESYATLNNLRKVKEGHIKMERRAAR